MNILRLSCFIFTINVDYAYQCNDILYHTAFLLLTCFSVARRWCCEDDYAIQLVDKVVAHACCGLCAWTHLITHPNVPGAACLATVVLLWISEFHQRDWQTTHCALHIISCIGTNLAISQRSKSV